MFAVTSAMMTKDIQPKTTRIDIIIFKRNTKRKTGRRRERLG